MARWKVGGALRSPKGMTFHCHRDDPAVASGSRNAVIGRESRATSIWWNPEAKIQLGEDGGIRGAVQEDLQIGVVGRSHPR